MVDKKSDTAKVAILPGVELTAEAQEILNKQLNLRIVWGYRLGKVLAIVLGLATIFGSIVFATMVGFPISDLSSALVAGLFFGIPFLIGAVLLLFGIKS